MNICIFICGFPVSILVSGIRGFGFGDRFPPESISGSGFDFGFWFWVHGDSTRSEPDPLPFLSVIPINKKKAYVKLYETIYKTAADVNEVYSLKPT